MTILVSKDVQCSNTSFDLYRKFVARCIPTLSPTQKSKHGFSALKSQGIGTIFISSWMISEALQTELCRIRIDSLGEKIQNFPEFNLNTEKVYRRDFFPKQTILTIILTSIFTVIRRLGDSIIISSNSISKRLKYSQRETV